jgi:hypothetical protein
VSTASTLNNDMVSPATKMPVKLAKHPKAASAPAQAKLLSQKILFICRIFGLYTAQPKPSKCAAIASQLTHLARLRF